MYEQRSYEFSFFGIVWSSLILSYLRLDHVSVRFTSLLWQTGSSASRGQTQKSKILKYKTASSKLSSRLTSTADLSVDTNLSLLLFLVSFCLFQVWDQLSLITANWKYPAFIPFDADRRRFSGSENRLLPPPLLYWNQKLFLSLREQDDSPSSYSSVSLWLIRASRRSTCVTCEGMLAPDDHVFALLSRWNETIYRWSRIQLGFQ